LVLAQAGTRTLTPQELVIWSRRSDFTVPVLNRGGAVDVRLFVTRTDYTAPVVSVHCSHLGLRLTHQPAAVQSFGVNQQRAAWLGLLVGFVVVAATVRTGQATWLGALVPWLTGASGILLGALITHVWRWISRLAG